MDPGVVPFFWDNGVVTMLKLAHLSEDHMTSVEPRRLLDGDEELTGVRVLPSVRHRYPASAVVLQFEVLVGEFFSIDGPASVSRCNLTFPSTNPPSERTFLQFRLHL